MKSFIAPTHEWYDIQVDPVPIQIYVITLKGIILHCTKLSNTENQVIQCVCGDRLKKVYASCTKPKIGTVTAGKVIVTLPLSVPQIDKKLALLTNLSMQSYSRKKKAKESSWEDKPHSNRVRVHVKVPGSGYADDVELVLNPGIFQLSKSHPNYAEVNQNSNQAGSHIPEGDMMRGGAIAAER